MAEWQEKGAGRIGNTTEPFDAPVGHFSRSLKGRGLLARGVRTLPLRTTRRSWAIQAHIAPRFWPQTKIPRVAAMR